MSILTSTNNQQNLPRYFARVFDLVGKLNSGRVDFILPDGRRFRAEGLKPGPVAEVTINNPDVFARLVREGDLGFCDAYLDGWWTTPDLQAFMDFIHADNDDMYDGFPGMALVRAWEKARFWFQSNTKRQALKNISYHYDLGNDFYGLWLDDTMTYSSALFNTSQESLEKAHIAKYASMVDQMGVQPGVHVLEIGCGWGGMAEYIGKELGCNYTGITISPSQKSFTEDRIRNNSLKNSKVHLCDYRDLKGSFDRIISIEMIEAVGEKYWDTYFSKINEVLKRDGLAGIQMILIDNKQFDSYRKSVDFIQKYIFPGGMLPSHEKIRESFNKNGLTEISNNSFGKSYAKTLNIWKTNFNDSIDKLLSIGIDGNLHRLFNYYFSYCEAGFSNGQIDVAQKIIKKN